MASLSRYTERQFYVLEILEFGENGNLLSYLKQSPEFFSNHINVLRLFRNILDGVNYFHEQGVCLAELKLKNVLLDGKLRPKIADFGRSRPLNADLNESKVLDSAGASLIANSLTADLKCTEKFDVYALGVTLYQLVHHG